MKLSSIPTSAIEPDNAPSAAPIAIPSNGMKKSSPNNKPQKLPPNAPAPVMLCSCSVLGFLRPSGQVTIAASTISISSAFCCLSSSWSAWRAPVAH